MALKHADIWRAIDRLAERHKLSPSGLALKAGLDPTAFNPSKRVSGKRKRWPSTESIARILQVTRTDLDAFVALAAPSGQTALTILPHIKPRKNDRVAIRTIKGKIIVGKLKSQSAQKIEMVAPDSAVNPVCLKRRDIHWMYRIV